jgi:hypothetical protein
MITHDDDPSLQLTLRSPETAITDSARCRRRGSTGVVVTRCATGPHSARVRRLECGRTRFAKTPWSIDRARNFTMPWGKYRGHRLADLAATEEGRGYLRWLAADVEGNASTAARVLLDHAFPSCLDGPSRKKDPAGSGTPTGSSETKPPSAEPRGSS